MDSIVARLRKDLEARGEYVVTANASTGWFAVFPTTWRDRIEKAGLDGRDGPNLIVCRTESKNARDHYVIPYSVIRELLVDGTMTTSAVDGSNRWNLTIKKGGLHVSHRPGTEDVSKYHGARLLLEDSLPLFETTAEDSEDQATTLGAGFGKWEENRKVEEAAVKLVSKIYRGEGWQVESVEEKRCGFDLRCLRDGEEAHVEVKGVTGAGRRFVLTEGELRCAINDEQFVLALVTSALSSRPVLERLSAARFRSSFTFTPIQYWATPVREDYALKAEPPRSAARGARSHFATTVPVREEPAAGHQKE